LGNVVEAAEQAVSAAIEAATRRNRSLTVDVQMPRSRRIPSGRRGDAGLEHMVFPDPTKFSDPTKKKEHL
jgi:hypothetical protein